MERDGSGVLGTFALDDYERLAGFDPDLAERVLLEIVRRIVRMIPAERLIAHVDQGHFAIWYGKDIDPLLARSEIDAIAYALGGRVNIDQREIFAQHRNAMCGLGGRHHAATFVDANAGIFRAGGHGSHA